MRRPGLHPAPFLQPDGVQRDRASPGSAYVAVYFSRISWRGCWPEIPRSRTSTIVSSQDIPVAGPAPAADGRYFLPFPQLSNRLGTGQTFLW